MAKIRRALSLKREEKIQSQPLSKIRDEHLISLEDLCQRLETDAGHGLTDADAKYFLKKEGKNKICRPKRPLSAELKDFITGEDNFTKVEWNRLFGKHIPEFVTVIREGKQKEILGEELVVGDIVLMEKQETVAADIRLISSNNVAVDNRLITSQQYEKKTHELKDATEDYLLSPNIAFAGTKILHGTCCGIVIKTGENTVFATLKNHARKVSLQKYSSA